MFSLSPHVRTRQWLCNDDVDELAGDDDDDELDELAGDDDDELSGDDDDELAGDDDDELAGDDELDELDSLMPLFT